MASRRRHVARACESRRTSIHESFLGKTNKRPNLEILDQPFEESYKMLRFSDIARNGFLEKVLRESYIMN
jgi:hypothetical protein